MTTELIGVIAATIALGTLLYAAMRGLRQDVRSEIAHVRGEIGVLREEMKAGDNALREEIGGLREQMQAGDASLRQEMLTGHASLREDMQTSLASLREDMQTSLASLREDMQAGFKELNARVGTVEHRLAKVEGIIEGLFWSTRNQPPDSPREGVA